MNDSLLAAYSSETFRHQAHALVDLLADHLDTVGKAEQAVLPYAEPDEQLAYWKADFQKPANADPLPLLADIVQRSIHLHNPRFMGHQVAPPLPLAALTGLLTGLLNNGMAVYEMGMTANALERIVTQWLARKMNFGNDASGVLTSGGTLANLTALLTARAVTAPTDVWEAGHTTRLAIMVSEEAHYCVDRAARIMGLGSEGIIKIPTNDRFQMRTELLENYLEQAKEAGLTVFAVVGSACSTSTGSYDNLVAIADFCQKHKLWFHVDGAHGGAVVLSDKYRLLVQGIERADSVVVDFHKMMMIPALVTAVLYQRDADSYQTFQQKAQYLWADATAKDWFNSGKRAFECTKLMMSVKVYTVLRTYGEEIFTANVETLYGLARRFADLVRHRPDFELAVEPESNIVCFRYVGGEPMSDELDALNTQLRDRLLKDGRFYIVQTTLRGRVYLRVSLMNPLTTDVQLEGLLEQIHDMSSDYCANL
ncbi:pyridoxal phosphate-dependent decarboxylase family protein [Spirosoma endbachense]|uniref:Aminotransferase class I/II-fold pyridoxal phosphate-dependent enzyme n=1 Tax=Spirosoma endbachense TaxID=2666025 RepID=A0A6P1VRN0_9BACT|nr:aminotransferase class I/II-fold pyridoxal phosphate-dependent enzyme [Spirosoma endbachense]QHV95881.1 aminotransferase class I/II-fold pyridoxal phosphate-dependent enzyme [Spirosoma endbachense]